MSQRKDRTAEEAGEGDGGAQLHADVRALFHELYELTPEDREARLDVLKTPVRLREELADLFANVDRPDSFDDSRLGELGDKLLLSGVDESVPGVPERIGDYVILGKIGEGGMGVVYAARRDGSDQRVAVKVIQPGVDVGRLSNRFRREIQVLEQLRHPGIASFHGAGQAQVETPTGEVTLPYLVMEFVDGDELLEYVERNGSSDRERISLIARICVALDHAHERGVVHRDLKPANILVVRADGDPVGQPKILDFGVALSRGSELATLTATQTGALIGTLPYMSPEQVDGSGRAADRRSDVYSLGVLMFQLLTGQLPYDVRDRPLIEAARVIAEVDPIRLGTAAPRCGRALEAIVGKALEKDRSYRYPTAAALAEDLQRYLRGDSVIARRPSLARELKKFARRHRVFVATATGVVLALSLGLASSIRYAMGEAAARRTADERTQAASWNLHRSMLRSASGAIASGDVALAEIDLAQTPEELRGWVWGVLEARLDASVQQFTTGRPFPPSGALAHSLFFDPEGQTLFVHDQLDDTCISLDLATGERAEFSLTVPAAVDHGATRVVQIFDGELVLSSFPERARLDSLPLPIDLKPVARRGLSFVGQNLVLLRTDGSIRSVTSHGDELGEQFEIHEERRTLGADATSDWTATFTSDDGLVVTNRISGGSWPLLVTDDPQGRWLGVGVSPDGTHLAGVSQAGSITSWKLDRADGPSLAWHRESRSKGARVLAISPDSSRMVVAGEAVEVFDSRRGERLSTLPGHRSAVRAVAFSRDGTQLASIDKEGIVRRWRLDGEPHVIRTGGFIYAADFDPSGQRVLVGTSDGDLIAYDVRTSIEVGRRRVCDGAISSISFDPNGVRCVVTGRDRPRAGLAVVLDVATGAELWTGRYEDSGRLSSAFSSDGQSIIVAGIRGFVAVVDAATGAVKAEVRPVDTLGGVVRALAIHPTTGEVFCGAEGGVEVYDAETLAHSTRFESDGAFVSSLAFSADGELIAAGSDDRAIRVWDVRSGELVAELLGHAQRVLGLCWSPDGTRLISGSRDATVKVWDTQRWTDVLAFQDHEDYVFSVRMTLDGEVLLSCGGDGTVRIWSDQTPAEFWAERLVYEAASERVTPLVERLIAESGLAAAEAAIRQKNGLSAREREVALQVLFARGLGGDHR